MASGKPGAVQTANSYIALVVLIIGILDVAFIDRIQRTKIRDAARVQEEFDCSVLQLPWNAFAAGTPLEPEAVFAAQTKYALRNDDTKIRDWYPTEVAAVHLVCARIICQRTNLWYDGTLRRRYSSSLLWSIVGLSATIAILGLAADLSMESFVLAVLAPLTPVLLWSAREYYRQRDTADSSDIARTEAEELWSRILKNELSDEQLTGRSRDFQDAIFRRRSTSPLIFDWVYKLLRPGMEKQMGAGAAAMIEQLRKSTR